MRNKLNQEIAALQEEKRLLGFNISMVSKNHEEKQKQYDHIIAEIKRIKESEDMRVANSNRMVKIAKNDHSSITKDIETINLDKSKVKEGLRNLDKIYLQLVKDIETKKEELKNIPKPNYSEFEKLKKDGKELKENISKEQIRLKELKEKSLKEENNIKQIDEKIKKYSLDIVIKDIEREEKQLAQLKKLEEREKEINLKTKRLNKLIFNHQCLKEN